MGVVFSLFFIGFQYYSMFSWFPIVFLIIMFSITQLNPASIHTQRLNSNHPQITWLFVYGFHSFFGEGGWDGGCFLIIFHWFPIVFQWFHGFSLYLIIMFSITQLNPASIHTQTELKPSSNHMVVCLWFS